MFSCHSRNPKVRAKHNAVLEARASSTTGGVGYHWPVFRTLRSGRQLCTQCENLRADKQHRARRVVRDEKAGLYKVPPRHRATGKRFARPAAIRDCRYHGLRVMASVRLDQDGREQPNCLQCKVDYRKGAPRRVVISLDNAWYRLPAGAKKQTFVTLDEAGTPYFRRGVVLDGYGVARGLTGWDLTLLDEGERYYPEGHVVHSTSTLQEAMRYAQKGL